MCISRAYTCIHVKYTCIHVKYTCYTPGNGLVVFATLKNPYFDPSHVSETSEIFLSLMLKNDPCFKNGTLKLFLCNFWPRSKCYHLLGLVSDRSGSQMGNSPIANCSTNGNTQNLILLHHMTLGCCSSITRKNLRKN